MQSELKRSKQYYRSVGTVYELGLTMDSCKVKTKDEDGNESQVDGERIKGAVTLRTQNGLHTFNAYFTDIGFDGKPSKKWKMANSMLEWNPEVNGNGEPPTLVSIEGTININDYPNEGKVYSSLRWNIGKATTKVDPEEPTGTSLSATCYVHEMKPEAINEEETGRLLVTLLMGGSKGACFPIDAIVDEKLVDFSADDFESEIELTATHPFTLDRITRHVGGEQKKKKMLGNGGSVKVGKGYDVEEIFIMDIDYPIEEPEEEEDENGNPIEDKSGYIKPSVMKKAIKVRDQMLEELKNNPPEKKSSNVAKERKERSKVVGKGNRTSRPVVNMDDSDDGDDPF